MLRKSFPISIACMLALGGCAHEAPVSPTEVQVVSVETLSLDPADPAWGGAPAHAAELLLQDMVEPRLLDPSTPRVEVRAMTDGARVAFRLSWSDESRNDTPGPASFSDACAVQLPRDEGPDVPAPQMGEPGRQVEVTFWRASWQASVDGRPDTIQALHPGASVDHYPFEAASLEPGSPEQAKLESQFAPARTLGNRMEGPRDRPVQDLLAEGPGTLTPAPEQVGEGRGVRLGNGWAVVIVRPLPQPLEPGERSQVAFAVWDGARDEVGARKMRSGWVPLHRMGEAG